eukprot:1606026-Ditylum_brightwellii.AAC.1
MPTENEEIMFSDSEEDDDSSTKSFGYTEHVDDDEGLNTVIDTITMDSFTMGSFTLMSITTDDIDAVPESSV